MSREMRCVVSTALLSAAAGLVIVYVWPYVVKGIQTAISFVSADTTNPVNLMAFGMMDRLSALLNLGAMVRTPFWYGSNGETWINMVGGSVAGDVNIWTNQLAMGNISGMTGRFITPYYVLNIFAVPGLLWGMYSVKTDFFDKRRTRMFFILTCILSVFSGTLLPVEMTLFLLCPLLYLFHLLYTGTLFAVFQAMGVYLGYNFSGTTVLSALPGSLLEFLSYLRFTGMHQTLLVIAVTGLVTFIIYFLFTRLYFYYLALDLFQTGRKETIVQSVVKACGGIENVKMTHSSASRLVISLYDPSLFDVNSLKQLGSLRVYDTKAGYAITFGASSTMIRLGINKFMRDSIRNTG